MIRTCPKCGDFYADGSLAFCLGDGMPLVDMGHLSERWKEGVRVIEEKEKTLRKQQRKLKLRRIFVSAMTMLIATMVVCVVAVNGLIYLKPKQETVALAGPSTPTGAPGGIRTSVAPNAPGEPAQTPTPTAERPTPSPRAADIATPTPTPTPSVTLFEASPSPTPKPSTDPSPTPTPTLIITLASTPTPTPTPALTACSDADKSRERDVIIKTYSSKWRGRIEDERSKIIAQNVHTELKNVEPGVGEIEYDVAFLKACTAALVTLRYVLQVRPNGPTGQAVNVARQKSFGCVRIASRWICN